MDYGSLELNKYELEDLRLYPRSQRDQYKEGSKVKFRVVGRPLYPEKLSQTGIFGLQYRNFTKW